MSPPLNSAVADYFCGLSEQRRQIVLQLHQLIVQLYPDVDVNMAYKMPTYKAHGGWVALASQKHYVSLYTCTAQHIAGFKLEYPSIKTGKACINFKPHDPLPLEALQKVIKSAIETSKHH
ncbi:MAG: DUF1801 domain-containing protein [Gammaproteobacteria bacterium]|nr:DUF1801 domain-containing protein [Gammaproteobacteria bacterium]